MNSSESDGLIAKISAYCADIVAISSNVVIHKNRSRQMGSFASQIAIGIASAKLRKSQRTSDALLLLSICLEDVKSFLERFKILNKDLAISVVKGGSHCLEFVKLTDQLQHCSVLVGLDIATPVDDGFNADCEELLSKLSQILSLIFNEFDKKGLHTLKTKTLISSQKALKGSYKSKGSRNDDVTMKSDDLVMVKPIGRGGYSTVWLGKFKGEDVAVKVLSVEASTVTLEEFQHEADLMRRLSNKNIVAYYGITEIDTPKVSGHCMIMEYMVNDSLYSYIKSNRAARIPWAEKVDIALDIVSGIAFLHRLRIIHRDIKLGNILLDEHLHAKVADFGLSFAKTANNSIYNMNEGGTIPYMAPECFGGNASYSTKSDVFAFAIVCWGIMHWDLPFTSYDRDLIKDMVWKERFRLPVDAKVPLALSSMIKLCWAQNYSHRPSMIKVKEFLEKLVFIDGVQTANPIFDFEMTTTATVTDIPTSIITNGQDLNYLPTIKENQPNTTNSINNIPTHKNLIPQGQPLQDAKKFFRRSNLLLCALIILVLLFLGVGVGIFLYISSNFNKESSDSKSPTTINNFFTTANSNATYRYSTKPSKTISRTPYPTATVKTLIKSDASLIRVYGIAIDENDVIYVILGQNQANPLVYKVNYGFPVTLTLIADLSLDNQGSSYDDQGLCYFGNALYVPRVGQLTKIDLTDNTVTRFAGSGSRNYDGTVMDGQNSSAVFCGATMCIADSAGNIYVGEDCRVIRKVNQTGYVSTIGKGLPGKPMGLALNGTDNLLFSTWESPGIFKIELFSENVLSTILGNVTDISGQHQDGQGLSSVFIHPGGMVFDELGNLYIADNFGSMIAKTNTTLLVSTFAGSTTNYGEINGFGTDARFTQLRQMVFDSKGTIFATDQQSNAIRMITW